jgi:hypothetical protein
VADKYDRRLPGWRSNHRAWSGGWNTIMSRLPRGHGGRWAARLGAARRGAGLEHAINPVLGALLYVTFL